MNEGAGPTSRPSTATDHHSLGRTILRNTLAITIGGGVMKVLAFAFTIYAVRALGEAGFGQYAQIVAFVTLFSIFFELGLTQYVERAIAQQPDRVRALFWNLVALRLCLALIGIVAIPVLAFSVGYERSLVLGTLIYTSTFALAAFSAPLATVLTARERFDLSTLALLLNQILTVAVGFLFLASGAGVYALLHTGFLAMAAEIALSAWLIRRHRLGPLDRRPTPHDWPTLIRAALPFGLTSLALAYAFNADTVILGYFHGDSVVGWYSVAYRLVFTLVGVGGGFVEALTPSLAREHVGNPTRVHIWVRGSLPWMSLVSLPLAVGTSLLAPRLVLLLYGPNYGPAGVALAILAWDIPLLLFNAFCGNVAAATELERPAARIFLLSAMFNVALNLLFIPRFGLIGAALVTVATDALAALCFVFLFGRRMQFGKVAAHLARIGLAAALMGGAIWFARWLALPWLIAIGIVSYGALILPLRLIEPAAIRDSVSRLARR